MIALVLLLIALVAVLVKDRQFWFGSEQATIESDMPPAEARPQTSTVTPVQPAATPRKQVAAPKTATQTKPAEIPAVTTQRTVLPPMDVEVIAGDSHRAVHPGSTVTRVEIPHQPAIAIETPTNAAERQEVDAALPAPQAPIQTSYPVLAAHSSVQGSVVLQAVIDTEGVIEDLKVLSGPSILASAAQQAVREWRFKPIFQNGKAVESKARITVNFSIKVADSAAGTTVADSRTSSPILTR